MWHALTCCGRMWDAALMAPISYLREALRPTPPVLLCVLSDIYVTAGIPVLRTLVREGHSRSNWENESLGQVLANFGGLTHGVDPWRTLGPDQEPENPPRSTERSGLKWQRRCHLHFSTQRCSEGAGFAYLFSGAIPILARTIAAVKHAPPPGAVCDTAGQPRRPATRVTPEAMQWVAIHTLPHQGG